MIVSNLTNVNFITERDDTMEYGYCRISTSKQNIERQVRNIKEKYPQAHIVRETFTGTKFQGRKELDKLLKVIKTKDCIIFDSVSRMSRNADEGCDLYEDLFNRGINLVFLKEPHVNSDVYRQALQNQIDIRLDTGNVATDEFMNTIIDALNKYTMELAKEQIRIAFEQAQKEVEDLHQRTREAVALARLNGKQIGQKSGAKLHVKKEAPAKEQIRKYNKTFGGQLTNQETWEKIGISKMTFYKYKRQIMEEAAR